MGQAAILRPYSASFLKGFVRTGPKMDKLNIINDNVIINNFLFNYYK